MIDEFVANNHFGYRDRAEVVAAALRRFLDEERLKGTQRETGKMRDVFDEWLVKAKQDLAREREAEKRADLNQGKGARQQRKRGQ